MHSRSRFSRLAEVGVTSSLSFLSIKHQTLELVADTRSDTDSMSCGTSVRRFEALSVMLRSVPAITMMDQGVLDCVTGAVMAALNVIWLFSSSNRPVPVRKQCA